MDIKTAMDKHYIYIENGDKWIVFRDGLFQVYQRKYRAKRIYIIFECETIEAALDELCAEE